ncbi:DELTA-sagatoxin-Srs1a-like [Conger conger]|uniref:DELTA-sagatoxin-Srs1a-like n=1 Tax=Conger conger TaxID=82655 RepID=UPI002A5A9C34|nr:DELTA-sagatoxin-Srs1a-like [Conger conger]
MTYTIKKKQNLWTRPGPRQLIEGVVEELPQVPAAIVRQTSRTPAMSRAGAASAVTSLVYHIAQKTVSSGLRSVIVHLTNSSSSVLINPQVYTSSGYSYDPPQPTVGKGATEVCAFGQTKGTARGSVGVLTYDIAKDRKIEAVKRLAIMFSVPFDYNLYENWFALAEKK